MITNYPADPGRLSGGVQAVSARLVAELSRVPDLELHVIHCHSDVSCTQVMGQGNVTLHFIAQSRRRLVPNMLTGVGLIARRLATISPDVVHAHGPSFAVAALRAGYQPIWTIHGVLSQEARNYPGLFNRLSFALASHYERQALARVRCITAVSRYVAEAYRLRTPTVIQVIENPAPAGYFTLPRRPVPGRVLMPAALIPLKDPLTLVRAAAQARAAAPELHLWLAGPLPDARYTARVRAEIKRLGLEGIVHLPGPLAQEQMEMAYAEAAVVALPSRQEVAPMAVVEAMAAGLPVVAAAVGGVPYLIEDGQTGLLVPPGDPVALSQALVRLLNDEALARRMGQAARATAATRFDAARIAGQYLALYRSQGGR